MQTAENPTAKLPGGVLGFITIVVMVCGPAMVGMMLTILQPVLPEIAKEVPVGRRMLITMPTLGIVAGGVLAGFLITRTSARALMLWMLLAFGIVGLAGMVLQGWPLLISRFLIGVVATCVSAASTTMIGDHISAKIRPLVLGFQMAGSSLAGILAMNVSAVLADAYSWRASFVLFPIIALLVLAPGVFLIPRSPPRAPAVATNQPRVSAAKLLIDLWPLYLFLLVMHATVYTANSQTPFLMADQGVVSKEARAHTQSINQIMIIISSFAYPLTRRFLGSRWIPAFFLTMAAGGLALLGLAHDLTQVGLGLALMGIGSGTLFPHQSNLILSRAAPQIRGRAVGLMVSNQFLADSINPWIYPPLAVAVGGLPNAILSVGLACGLGALVALVWGTRATNVALPEGAKSFGH